MTTTSLSRWAGFALLFLCFLVLGFKWIALCAFLLLKYSSVVGMTVETVTAANCFSELLQKRKNSIEVFTWEANHSLNFDFRY